MSNAHIEDEDEIRKGIQRAEFVKKGKSGSKLDASTWKSFVYKFD
jgi:hypothetical protein